MTIKMKDTASSMLHSYGHDPATNELHLTFRSKNGAGATHVYSNVDAAAFAAFEAAESKGKHFGAHFKGNERHPSRKL